MRRSVMAIVDREESYAAGFMDYVNRRNSIPFEVRAFSDADRLKECLERRSVEILLISERCAPERIGDWPIRQIVLLTETKDEPTTGGEDDGDGLTEESGETFFREAGPALPRICKYQAVSEIVREVMDLYARAGDAAEPVAEGGVLKPRTRTVGIFSPVGRCLKTSFSVALAQCLSEKKPTLLINMETCSGFGRLAGGLSGNGRSISDVVYYIRQGDRNLMAKILPSVRNLGELALLPPFEAAAELLSVTADEWRKLLRVLRTESTYEAVVLDLGEIPLLMPELLEECDVIYMPAAGTDPPGEAKMAEFGKLLSSASFSGVRGRIRRLVLPAGDLSGGGGWFRGLSCGPLGMCARECIARDRL